MNVKAKRAVIWVGMSMAGAALLSAAIHHWVSGALIFAGGLLAGISLLLNTHLVLNNVKDIAVEARSAGYDRRSHIYSRAAALLLLAGMMVALAGH